MRKYLLMLLMGCLALNKSNAFTISGRIEDASTCSPLAGQKVYLRDSIIAPYYNYEDSAFTDATGHYSFTIPASVPTTGNAFVVSFVSCGQFYRQPNYYYSAWGDIRNVDFAVCGTPALLRVNPNYHYAGPGSPYGDVMIYLVRKSYDPVIGDTVLHAIDSIMHDVHEIYPIVKGCVPTGKLLVKAVLMPTHPLYASYMPTYKDYALSWSSATEVSSADWGSYTNFKLIEIDMVAGVNPGGPGFIGGSVLVGANKSTSVGDPLSKKLIMLTKSNDSAVAFTYSDASGNFSFPSLAYGSYKLFGDVFGKTNPPLTVTLSTAVPRAEDIVFEENSKSFKGRTSSLKVGGSSALQQVRIFPNPASGFVNIAGLASVVGEKTISLIAVTGARVATQIVAAGQEQCRIAMDALPPGVYLCRIATRDEAVSVIIRK